MENLARNIKLIRSKDNDFYKKLKSYGQLKYRKRDNVVVVEGQKIYDDALPHLELHYTVVSESYFAKHQDRLFSQPEQSRLTVLADSLFASLSELKTDQGIMGIFQQPDYEVDASKLKRVVLLEDVQDPTNVGAIIRSAHCLGYEAVFLGAGCAQPFSPKVIRSSMGAVFHLPVVSLSDVDQLHQHTALLKEAGFSIVGTTLSGSSDVVPATKLALVIGSEGHGLTAQTLDLCDHAFTIEMSDRADSLNAAVASGIAMYLLREV